MKAGEWIGDICDRDALPGMDDFDGVDEALREVEGQGIDSLPVYANVEEYRKRGENNNSTRVEAAMRIDTE